MGIYQKVKDSQAVEWLYSGVHGAIDSFLYRFSPAWTAHHRYRRMVGRPLPLNHPVTFDEKLIWLMLRWHPRLKIQCADKLGMRAYVENRGYGHLLVELLGTYERGSDIDFALLPDQFVLKCTHGCGFNLICQDKGKLDQRDARRRMDHWLKRDYARVHGEVQYEGLRPRILCERFLDDGSGGLPADFKLNCFHGRLVFTTVCTGRVLTGGCSNFDHYDREWQKQLAISKFGLHPERWRPQPESYSEMIEAAEALSKPFPYVRMDFYDIGGKPYLGEMTFSPSGCIDTGYTDQAQRELGDLIQLPAALAR